MFIIPNRSDVSLYGPPFPPLISTLNLIGSPLHTSSFSCVTETISIGGLTLTVIRLGATVHPFTSVTFSVYVMLSVGDDVKLCPYHMNPFGPVHTNSYGPAPPVALIEEWKVSPIHIVPPFGIGSVTYIASGWSTKVVLVCVHPFASVTVTVWYPAPIETCASVCPSSQR